MLAPWKKSYDKPRQYMKKQRYHSAKKGPYRQIYGFSSSHVWIWELDHKEGWAPKNWCFWTVVLENSWESLGLQGDQTVNPIGNKSWILIGRSDAEAEAPILWSPDANTKALEKKEVMKKLTVWALLQFSSVAQSCLTLCDPKNRSPPGLSVHHQLQEFTQTHVCRVGDAIYHYILCCSLLLLPSIFPSIRVFSN